nr:ribonuclease HII [Chlorobium phaeovibrioides]
MVQPPRCPGKNEPTITGTRMLTDYEEQLWNSMERICGIDEAGRGPLAGPVVAAAVVFPRWFRPGKGILGRMNDSKKLSPSLRREMAPAIQDAALAWSVSVVDAQTIDRINILSATMLAMNRAVGGLGLTPDMLLVDGNRFSPETPVAYRTLVGGDAYIYSIAAASVLAKTARDAIMSSYDREYPEYGFARHAGYPTAMHISAIRQHGRCPIHRFSFKVRRLNEA